MTLGKTQHSLGPIGKAVDDKAAKNLLWESFKRQLKYDGTYSRVTFICSKTDDISTTEAADTLNLEDRVGSDWAKEDEIEDEKKTLQQEVKDLIESKGCYMIVSMLQRMRLRFTRYVFNSVMLVFDEYASNKPRRGFTKELERGKHCLRSFD
jgi:hypothetical protein